MWCVPVERMCRKHLLGEHVEVHMLVGSLRAGRSIDGFKDGLVDCRLAAARHAELAAEMTRRGYVHRSPLPSFDVPKEPGHVDPVANAEELRRRCPDCCAAGV